MSTDHELEQLRLDRIERKIDELGEAFVILARVEEKIVTLEQSRIENNRRYDDRNTQFLNELAEIRKEQLEASKKIDENTRVTGYIRWIVGVFITAISGAVALQFFA